MDEFNNFDDSQNIEKIKNEFENKIKVLNNLRIINKSVFENITNPVILYDWQSDAIIFTNNSAAKFYNTSINILTKSKLDLIDPFLVKEIRNIKQSLVEQKINFIYEKIILSKSIQKLYEVSLSIIYFGSKQYYLIEIMDIDKWEFTRDTIKSEFIKETSLHKQLLEKEIEKRRLAEQKLTGLSTKINLITNLRDSFFYTIRVISNSRFQLIEASKGFKKITGYELRDVEDLGGWTSIISQGDLPQFHKQRLKLTPNEITWGEYRVIDKNGEFIWLKDYMFPQFEETGRFIQYIYGFAEDISKLKKIEEDFEKIKNDESKKNTLDLNNLKTNMSNKVELKSALEYYQKVVFDLFPYQIFHENGIIIDASTKFQEITGIMINPLARKTLFEIFDSSERTEYLKQIQGNNTNSFTVKIKNRNGDTIISFEAINIMCEYRDRMIKLLAMRNPEY
ncbi:MAG TPA: PAS domain-containing protein [Melioribacteraceae bacterium]|nr:PAS domain-containing protein [Melioribacteraceae bacterium]